MGRPGGFSAQREGSQESQSKQSVFAAIRDFGRAPSAPGCARGLVQPMPKSWARALRIWCCAVSQITEPKEPTSRRPRTLIGAIPSRGFAQINASTGLRRARRPAALRRAAEWPRPRKLVPLCGSSCTAAAKRRRWSFRARLEASRVPLIPSRSRRGRCLRARRRLQSSCESRRFRRRRGRR